MYKDGSKKTVTLDKWFSQEKEEVGESKERLEEKTKETPLAVKKEEKENATKSYLINVIRDFERNFSLIDIRDKNTYFDLRRDILEAYRPKKILIVTEKPKVGEKLAYAISDRGKPKRFKITHGKKSFPKWLTYLNGVQVVIIPLKGHITEYTTIKEYSGDWVKSDPIKIITDEKSLIEIVKEKTIEKELIRESKDSDVLIIATDADEEGANIGLEAYKIVSRVKKEIPTFQLWFLSLDIRELKNAFKRPIEPKWSWAYSVEGRRIVDALVGFSSTRELTLFLQNDLKKLGINVASIGRVQTPTLYLIYLREKEIREFKPKPYWTIYADILVNGRNYRFHHVDSPIYSEKRANEIYNRVKGEKKGHIEDIHVNVSKMYPPLPLNTTRALSEINRLFGISSYKALRILEDLYLNGLITYPRTDTDKYPEKFDHASILRKLTNHPNYQDVISNIIQKGAKLRRNGRNLVGDHLPITPIDVAYGNDPRLPTQNHKTVYEFILTRYISLFLDPAIIERRKIILSINNEKFNASDLKILNKGFLSVYPFDAPSETTIPVKKGDFVDVSKIGINKEFTKPPRPLTEYELIKLMERLGLGTKSTRQTHIETLIKRKYIERIGRSLKITPLGYSIMEYLEKIWPDFVKPFFSANIQNLMREVMNGDITKEEMIHRSRNSFLKLFQQLRKTLPDHGKRFSEAIDSITTTSKIIDCPKCGSLMFKKEISKKAYLLKCNNCGFSIVLPKFKKIEIVEGVKCKICGATPLALHRKRILYLCPICFKEIGPCFKCTKLSECDIGKLLKVEEEKLLVGHCSDNSLAIYVPEKKIVICKDSQKKEKYFLPSKGSVKLLKNKRCNKCGWRLFSIRRKNSTVYYCAKCGTYINP